MEPRIQYCKTTDSVNIAYTTLGDGPPLLLPPPMVWGHLTLEWTFVPLRDWLLRLAESYTLIRYDPRNSGLSDRGVADSSVDAVVRDTESVLDRLDTRDATVFAHGGWTISSLVLAAKRPELVRKLVLYGVMARWDDYYEGNQAQVIRSLLERDWRLFRETLGGAGMGWSGMSHDWAQFVAASTTHEDAIRLYNAASTWDASPYLGDVRADTLVINPRRGGRVLGDVRGAREVVSGIPNARLLEIADDHRQFFESSALGTAIDDALGISSVRTLSEEGPSGTAVILFADIADSTALTERLGDAAFREKARALDEALRRAITSNGGTAIEGKVLGDGVLATFGAAREAIACASACHAAARAVDLALHVGVHAGDVIRESNNVYGGAVNIASRVASEAAAGETLVSATVRELARTSAGVSFEDRGERELKGVGERVRVYAVRWREE
jgi:class 3 adenylate cyclase